MSKYILSFDEIQRTDLPLVGGKGVNLGELSRIPGLFVPPGFCVTTEAWRSLTGTIPKLNDLLDRLAGIEAKDREAIAKIAGRIRDLIENTLLPDDVAADIRARLARFGENAPCAVRSSATAEDLPGVSFAGQQDSYLNVVGPDALLLYVRKCMASLFTDRAVVYRMQNGFDHRKVALSVVIQRMLFPEASGILFTADPVSGNRKVVSIDAGFGLGEALVSGIVSADSYRVRDGRILEKTVSDKRVAVTAAQSGGTREEELAPALRTRQVLTDGRILELAALGRKIEAHYLASGALIDGEAPQDIEWCLANGEFHILQSRPITTLYPIPAAKGKGLHLFVCANHMQMMTDPIRPLGISFFRDLAEAYADIPAAGGRLYMDTSADMHSFVSRNFLLYTFGETDVLIRNILRDASRDKNLMKRLSREGKGWLTAFRWEFLKWAPATFRLWLTGDVGGVPKALETLRAMVEDTRKRFADLSGQALLDALDHEMKTVMDTWINSSDMGALLMAWIVSHGWLQKKMKQWLGDGEEAAVDILSKSVPNNPTSEMGLALLDVSNVARGRPAVLEYLERARDEDFLEGLRKIDGGDEFADALSGFLEKYGMRCSGEIDITRPRWSEHPTALVPMILGNVENPDASTGAERFERGRLEAEQKEAELLARISTLKGGKRKARKMRKAIALWRGVSGFREYPKFFMVRCFAIYKAALLREADRLVGAGTLREREDIYYLTLQELKEAVRTGAVDNATIERRRNDYARYEKLTPPRVLTSEGEILRGGYGASKAPEGALVGMPVSAGTVEGTARVVLRQQDADIRPGDILVTPFTDPSWTPLFVSVKGLVTEVGGRMTHGAVITREYGLPAVVGVENATKRIQDGQKIRVNGTEGWVEVLGE